jgi:hypothetical protein
MDQLTGSCKALHLGILLQKPGILDFWITVLELILLFLLRLDFFFFLVIIDRVSFFLLELAVAVVVVGCGERQYVTTQVAVSHLDVLFYLTPVEVVVKVVFKLVNSRLRGRFS